MERTHKHKTGLLVVALVAALAAVVLTGGATAALVDSNVTVDDPNNQTVEVDVSFSGSTDATAELTEGSSVVESATVSGSSGATETVTLNADGIQSGTYGIDVTATDESVVSLSETTLITHRPSMLNLSKDETVTVDVEFSSADDASAVVELSQHGTTLGSETLNWFYTSAGDESGVKTAEIAVNQNVEAANITVETSPSNAHSQVWVSGDDDTSGGVLGGGAIGGASQDQLIGFVAVVVGLVLVYQRDLI
ncbi:hypothetical protein [Halovenus salina]|uniref:PGF-CTERM sorting domain-containing protein n=1 Tax=Halovenus salina TaxID=1510225 RepID=A0ABD5VZK8_9EURY|nr:hypothetical protein [Halovenus salina]